MRPTRRHPARAAPPPRCHCVSSRIAPGCNIANLITGIGGLSLSSVLVVIGMMIGVFVVVAYVFRMPLMLFRRDDTF
ncbi:YeeE/YedE thiosulfate transporter family protein [Paenibacillus cymbidii]|uniref:YeeE/YedE thiosulfate transporter family protein n=1 Tax=Paenibacillus cymbidii TaxID=1639034 RepID=UPI001436C3FA|nr:YeeE/YedE thiosulfate transporter family protein [Paenibacillus cymbidii]